MYTIQPKKFHGIETIELRNNSTGEFLSVIPSFGGNIHELHLKKRKEIHSIILGNKSKDELLGIGNNYYRGSKLSPFPNRINNATYKFKRKTYKLLANDGQHALHGMLWNAEFAIESKEENKNFAKLVLSKIYNNDEKGYPFQYKIEIEYTLKKSYVLVKTKITNLSLTKIPIGDGWHPYFSTGSDIESLQLQIPAKHCLEMDETKIPTGRTRQNKTFLRPKFINKTILDHCFEITSSKKMVETRLFDQVKNITIVLFQKTGKKGYNYIQLYTSPDRKSIAIEPMSCMPNAFNEEEIGIILKRNKSITYKFGIKIE
jgi:aldose 1-epimerase